MKKTFLLLSAIMSSVTHASPYNGDTEHEETFPVFTQAAQEVHAAPGMHVTDDEKLLPSFKHLAQYAPTTLREPGSQALGFPTSWEPRDDESSQTVTLQQRLAFVNASVSSSSQCNDDTLDTHTSTSSAPTLQRRPSPARMASTQMHTSTQELLTHIAAIQDPSSDLRYTKGYSERVACVLKEKNVTAQDMYRRMEEWGQKEDKVWKKAYPLVHRALITLRTQEKEHKTGVSIATPSVARTQRSYDLTVTTQTLLAWFREQSVPMTNPQECHAVIQSAAQEHDLSFAAIYGRLEKYKKNSQSDPHLWTPELESLRKSASKLKSKFYAEQKKEAARAPSQDASQVPSLKPAPRSESLIEWFKEQNMPMTNPQECHAVIERAAQEHGLEYSTIFGRLARHKQRHQSDPNMWTPALEGLRKSASQLRMKVYEAQKKGAPKAAQQKVERTPVTILPKTD